MKPYLDAADYDRALCERAERGHPQRQSRRDTPAHWHEREDSDEPQRAGVKLGISSVYLLRQKLNHPAQP